MIELTQQQSLALGQEKQPAAAVDLRTGQVYRLIRQEVYEVVCGSLKSQAWNDDSEMDDYEQFRKKP